MAGVGWRFDLAPREALAFYRGKGLKASFAWQDMLHEEHDRAFTVAKMLDLDLLSDVKAFVDRALAEGWTREQFVRELRPELQRRGWWGKKEMIDPQSGETKLVQLGSPRRLRTIFDANMRTSYAAGHWAKIADNAKRAPFVMYVAVLDARTRPQHRAWHGKVLRWDDPWWAMHTPPNGWNCRCTVIQLSQRDLEAMGKSGPDQAPATLMRNWTNPRTGEVIQVPVGVDPGWGYAPNRESIVERAERAAREKAAHAIDPAIARAFLRSLELDPIPGVRA